MGIPQGSLIAPILFSIMIHDLPKSASHATIIVQYTGYIYIYINVDESLTQKKKITLFCEK